MLDLLPRIRYGLCRTRIWLFSGKVQFAEQLFSSQSVHQEGPSFLRVLFVESCQNQLGLIYASVSSLSGTLWSFTCFLQDFVSFLVSPTLGPVYKLLLILSFSGKFSRVVLKTSLVKTPSSWCPVVLALISGQLQSWLPGGALSVSGKKLGLPYPSLQAPIY